LVLRYKLLINICSIFSKYDHSIWEKAAVEDINARISLSSKFSTVKEQSKFNMGHGFVFIGHPIGFRYQRWSLETIYCLSAYEYPSRNVCLSLLGCMPELSEVVVIYSWIWHLQVIQLKPTQIKHSIKQDKNRKGRIIWSTLFHGAAALPMEFILMRISLKGD